MGCAAPKSDRRPATATSATFFPTGRSRRGCAIASILRRCGFRRWPIGRCLVMANMPRAAVAQDVRPRSTMRARWRCLAHLLLARKVRVQPLWKPPCSLVAVFGACRTLRSIDGVLESEVGYIGGSTPSPDYVSVKAGRTGHAKRCVLCLIPTRLSFADLLASIGFFACMIQRRSINKAMTLVPSIVRRFSRPVQSKARLRRRSSSG